MRRACGANVCLVILVDRIAVFWSGEHGTSYVICVPPECILNDAADLRITADKTRADVADKVAKEVVGDHELPINVWAGANAIHQHVNAVAHVRRCLSRHGFEQHAEGPCVFERARIIDEAVNRLERLTLHTISA